jgi:TRAP-type C4-dicarboxylate transport system permease small subunit
MAVGMVKWLFIALVGLCIFMQWIGGLALVSIMFLTVSDVILRRLGMPIDWTYEVVVLLGAIAIGFSLPQTTLDKAHVSVNSIVQKLPRMRQKSFVVVTRCLGIFIFALFGWRSFPYGSNLWESGQVSANLHLPEYLVAYGIGACCFIVCFVLLHDLVREVKS